jgi:methylenetetrahydrofolate reductase (NADPH)
VLDTPPKFFLGAASNPFVPPYDFRPLRLGKKIEAGAEFFQTQYCYDLPRFRQFMSAVRDLGLHERAFILVGVGPLRSAKAAEWMRSHVPGVVIPDEIIHRLEGVPSARQREEGKRICIEIIQEVREIEGVSGVHVMAYRQEELVAEIIEAAGLLPRRMQKKSGIGL